MRYFNFFVRPLKAEVLKSHIIFIIQNSYGGRAFLPSPAETELAKLSFWFNLNFTLIKGLVETFSQPFA